MSKIKCIIEMDEDEYKRVKNAECSYDGFEKGTFGYYLDIIQKTATPITECDDAVSRQAVINAIEKEEYKWDALDAMKALPPVLPKREQGEWIFEEVGVRTQVLKCSKCGTIIQRGENFTQKEFRDYINDILREKCITLDNFCHNCGAEMR